MRDIWQRIEAVLATTSPNLLAALAPGASAQAIASAEDRLGLSLPDDVRQSYAVHNGSGVDGILPQSAYGRVIGVIGVSLLSLDEIVRDTKMWQEFRFDEFDHSRAQPNGPIRKNWWNQRWVPVTWDGGGDHLCLDFDPAPGGVAGQVICFSHEIGPVYVVAENWRAFMEEFAKALETGKLRFNENEDLIAE